MPLIKIQKYESPELYDYNMRRQWYKDDYFRTYSNGVIVSARATSFREDVVIEGLKAMAESAELVTREALDLYMASQEVLCQEMTRLFSKVNKLAIHPHSDRMIPIHWPGLIQANPMRVLAFIPVGAYYAGHRMLIMFRVFKVEPDCDYSTMTFDHANTGCVGLCKSTIETFSKELGDYVRTIEQKALRALGPVEALNQIHMLLRPEEARVQAMEQAKEKYGSVFGTWG